MVNGSLRLFNHWNWKSCRISNPLLSESVHSSHHSRHKLTFFSHCCSRLCVLYPKSLHESCPWSYYSLPVNLFYLSIKCSAVLFSTIISLCPSSTTNTNSSNHCFTIHKLVGPTSLSAMHFYIFSETKNWIHT